MEWSAFSSVVPMLQAMHASNVVPLVRVPWLDAGAIMKALDAGAYGVICPMVNNRQQAEQLVSYVRYPPDGTRSFGPTRALFSAGADYAREANDEILCLAMIETAEAMENLEDIVSTPGIDGVYIGPSDLALGIGNGRLAPHFDREEEEMVTAIKKILAAAHAAGIRAALHCGTPEYAAKAVGWGFDMVTISSDGAAAFGCCVRQRESYTRIDWRNRLEFAPARCLLRCRTSAYSGIGNHEYAAVQCFKREVSLHWLCFRIAGIGRNTVVTFRMSRGSFMNRRHVQQSLLAFTLMVGTCGYAQTDEENILSALANVKRVADPQQDRTRSRILQGQRLCSREHSRCERNAQVAR